MDGKLFVRFSHLNFFNVFRGFWVSTRAERYHFNQSRSLNGEIRGLESSEKVGSPGRWFNYFKETLAHMMLFGAFWGHIVVFCVRFIALECLNTHFSNFSIIFE